MTPIRPAASTRDYSEAPELVRLLAALLAGQRVTPPAPHQLGRLLELTRKHRVDRLVTWHITKHGGDLCAWFGDDADALCEEVRRAAVLDAIGSRELAQVLSQLGAVHGARPLVFKGAALAHTHYREPWLRPRLDTDILISRSTTEAVFNVLQSSGYIRAASNAGTLVMSQASFAHTDVFGVTHALDVHWEIANWHVIARVVSHADLASRAVALPALGRGAQTLADADALLIACLHRAAHHRDSQDLLWLYDIHLLVERLRADGWAALVDTAKRGRVTSLCRRGLTLAAGLFGSAVPDHALAALISDAPEPSSIYLSGDVRLVDGLVSDLRALSFRQAIRLLGEHMWPSAEYMRQKHGATSPASLLLAYARRLASGVPRWFSARGWS